MNYYDLLPLILALIISFGIVLILIACKAEKRDLHDLEYTVKQLNTHLRGLEMREDALKLIARGNKLSSAVRDWKWSTEHNTFSKYNVGYQFNESKTFIDLRNEIDSEVARLHEAECSPTRKKK